MGNSFRLYFSLGWDHIMSLEALDHIFFIMALAAIYLLRDWKQVLVLVTAFTVGHAITLLLSALELVSVSEKWVEFLIPCTIIATGVSNLFLKTFTKRTIRINYFLALFFGLIHGLAFASNLKWMLASGETLWLPWIAFSIGLELGQLLAVVLILLLAFVVVQKLKLNRRVWTGIISIGVALFALKMAIERWPL